MQKRPDALLPTMPAQSSQHHGIDTRGATVPHAYVPSPSSGLHAVDPRLAPHPPSQPPPGSIDPRVAVQLPAQAHSMAMQPSRRALWIAGLVGTLLLGLVIGIAIGSGTGGEPPVAVAAVEPAQPIGRLRVTSKPTDGNVTIDGRFVGVSPIERLDLDPGKHSVVIDAFGYQPYAGTLSIDAGGKLNLDVLLAPIGGTGSTSGNVSGTGKATPAKVPASSLVTAQDVSAFTGTGKSAANDAKKPPKKSTASSSSYSPPPAFQPPPRPQRDCSGEKYKCRDGCSRAETDCRFSCSTCSSCLSSMGQDECRRQCEMCRGSCERNTKFCESSCDTQYNICQSSN